MSEFDITVGEWLAPDYGSPEVQATVSALRIEARNVAITEVEDRLSKSVRPHIYVPAIQLAEWLTMNWWRLRWEARPARPSIDWRYVHNLAAIGGDTPWPALELSSDGEFINLQMTAEDAPDVSAIRYIRNINIDIPTRVFEAAVDRFLNTVEARLGAVLPKYADLRELRIELNDERGSSVATRECRWQARAGIHPGDASEAWLLSAGTLIDDTGDVGGEEILDVAPNLSDGLASAKELIESMKSSNTTVDLSLAKLKESTAPRRMERPWERGARLAQSFREQNGLGAEVLTSTRFSELLATALPLQGEVTKAPLGGGFRNGAGSKRTRVLFGSRRPESQRFFLARLLGAAHVLPPREHLVPVTDADTALQKMERSFAQELLCPWAALDAFTDDEGLGNDALEAAADHFGVSEWLVRSTLVNRGKLPRDRLPSQLR